MPVETVIEEAPRVAAPRDRGRSALGLGRRLLTLREGSVIVITLLVAAYSPVPATITWWSVALAFGVSVAVGVFFGVYPARKAARMQPIAALRYE